MECMSIVVILGSSPRMRGTRVHDFGLCHNAGIIPAYAGNTGHLNPTKMIHGDHPRVCGEHTPQLIIPNRHTGSSPRMRGTRIPTTLSTGATGIIPAYAGNTFFLTMLVEPMRDHPRVCGEHTGRTPQTRATWGSSPRMRGTLSDSSPRARLTGIIPAYAGNTKPMLIWWMSPRDHPRVCGEHRLIGGRRHGAVGSSPRMRGTPRLKPSFPTIIGIIPAYAGNTPGPARCRAGPWDHPRVCGEHQSAPTKTVQRKGSSPRMRGTPNGVEYRIADTGIIPAYAGNTTIRSPSRKTLWDHPRVCGEHPIATSVRSITLGSSPRMRGTLPPSVRQIVPAGIIPAYAGNTRQLCLPRLRRRDHPRVCGEHIDPENRVMFNPGSSPRMRGTPAGRTC